ncbi:MAG: 16S rRNA (cytidine1402-2'-O)-methyltransferase [Flavobacteriaceae bacterium]|jgi:16S rRNA (cytidine1402-2'-O)-methyltransferase
MEYISEESYGILYIVATPIGNLGDVTFRAIETLKSVDLILAEDTRVTRKLCNHFDISKPLQSYRSQTETDYVHKKIQERLMNGENIALVSDAGTPGISDPGSRLVQYIREHNPQIVIIPIGGISAVTTLLSASGVDTHNFVFLGFAPAKKGRKTFFEKLGNYNMTTVLYESVHRIEKFLHSLDDLYKDSYIVVGRELTKMHEQIVTGTPADLLEYFENHPDKVRGEFVILFTNRPTSKNKI